MNRIIFLFLIGSMSLSAGIKSAADEVFARSACSFLFEIPQSFGGVLGAFVGAPDRVGEVAQKRSWQNPETFEIIQVKWERPPTATWETKSAKEIFAQIKANALSNPGMTIISERSYERNGYQAHSFVFHLEGRPYARMDCILTAPEINFVWYISDTPDTKTSQELFASIAIKPKTSTK